MRGGVTSPFKRKHCAALSAASRRVYSLGRESHVANIWEDKTAPSPAVKPPTPPAGKPENSSGDERALTWGGKLRHMCKDTASLIIIIKNKSCQCSLSLCVSSLTAGIPLPDQWQHCHSGVCSSLWYNFILSNWSKHVENCKQRAQCSTIVSWDL